MEKIRARNFCFTLNNFTKEQYDAVCAWDCKYIVVGKEVGESGTPHLQGFVCFVNARSFASVKKLCTSAHWEVSKGTPEQASTYCKKDDKSFFEKGDLPLSAAQKGDAEKNRWKEALKCVQEGRVDDVPADILCVHLRSIQYAAAQIALSKRKVETLSEWQHEWRYGKTECGKSENPRLEHPGAYIKDPQTEWWDGYKDEDVVIIDDFDKYNIKHSGNLKRWLDKYPFQAQVKNAYMMIRPKKIIVTSNYHPSEIWSDEQTLGPILRRVKVIELFHDPDYKAKKKARDSFFQSEKEKEVA